MDYSATYIGLDIGRIHMIGSESLETIKSFRSQEIVLSTSFIQDGCKERRECERTAKDLQ